MNYKQIVDKLREELDRIEIIYEDDEPALILSRTVTVYTKCKAGMVTDWVDYHDVPIDLCCTSRIYKSLVNLGFLTEDQVSRANVKPFRWDTETFIGDILVDGRPVLAITQKKRGL